MIEEIKRLEKVKKDLEEVRNDLNLIRNNLRLLRKKSLIKETIFRDPRPPLFRNFKDREFSFGLQLESVKYYTKDEYKEALYKKFNKDYSLSEGEIDSYYNLSLDVINQSNFNFKSEIIKKDEIFFEHSDSEFSESESE